MDGLLPEGLFDGQEYVDPYQIKWVYSKETDCWRRIGRVDTVPVADGTNVGLLSKEFKFLIDSVADKGGGFALVTKPLLAKRTGANPDGVLFGDIEFLSDTLKIDCVHSDGRKIGDACIKVTFTEADDLPPGFDINFSDPFLNSLCVEVPGGPGHTGPDGLKGDPGDDGTGDGPVGLKGEKGKDATTSHRLGSVRIVDVDDIFDTAVVKLELDAPNGKLFVTKAKIALPEGDDAAADQLVVNQISRTMKFSTCFNYELVKVPCRFDDDYEILDPLIGYYPASFDSDNLSGNTYQLVRGRLSHLIDNIISFYQGKLDEAADFYDKKIETFIKNKDDEARKVLDELGDRLAECENITYLEYCVGIEGECNEPPTAADPVGPTDLTCQALIEIAGCSDSASSTCQTLGQVVLTASTNPVLSINSPPPTGNYIPGPATVIGRLPTQEEIFDDFRNIYTPALQAAVDGSMIIYPKTQVKYSEVSTEFPSGTYSFIYEAGSFRQERRSPQEQLQQDPTKFINGDFQSYFVGNEGNGGFFGPLCLTILISPFPCELMTVPFASTEIGVEVGFAPKDYVSEIPDDYFDTHPYDIEDEIGVTSVNLPYGRIDHDGLSASALAMERKISWTKFPTISGSHADAIEIQQSYLNATLDKRMVQITTNQAGFFFMRVKVAIGFLNASGLFVMPPVTQTGALGSWMGRPYPPTPVSFNKAFFRSQDGETIPFVNAKPFAEGNATFKVAKVNCEDLAEPALSAVTGVEGTGEDPNPAQPNVDNKGNPLPPDELIEE